MEKRARILLKLAIVAVLSLLFIWLVYTDEKVLQLKQPEGEMISAKDVSVLLTELKEAGAAGIDEDVLALIRDVLTEESDGLRYQAYLEILEILSRHSISAEQGKALKQKLTYKNRYKKEFYLLKKDWYDIYGQILAFYGLEDVIREEKITILCGGENLADCSLAEHELIDTDESSLIGIDGSVYIGVGENVRNLQFISLKAYVRGNRILTPVKFLQDRSTLKNVWIMEDTGEEIQFFYKGYEILGNAGEGVKPEESVREQVGDISFGGGALSQITVKDERIGGKLLSISDDEVEIEGYGKLSVADNCAGYRLYEGLRQAKWEELPLGYNFADFVLDNGKVCAFLITRMEKMETIRVAVKTGNFSSLYHDKIILSGESGMTVSYGTYEARQQEHLKAGEELVIEAGSSYLSGERMEVIPDINTGKIRVLSLERSQGTPSYRGKMEIMEKEEGLVLINEVLMEEYLYSVVPSEMPASYPAESLKAQAVCARTYGYLHLMRPGYGNLGAHVDDSVSYQVYNNIVENVAPTKAVKETAGTLLLYEGEPVTTYYYSTSCGFGADAGVWNGGQEEAAPYLASSHIAKGEDGYSPEEMAEEDNFRDYIFQTDENAYEKNERWFRWRYYVDEADTALLCGKLRERYGAVPSKVLTWRGEGDKRDEDAYEEKEPEEFTEIYDIQCLKRRPGGVMDELLLTTDRGIYKIISEYNIRYILNQGGEATGWEGDSYACTTLLPSAYFAIDVVKSGENVIGYTLIGGGYGHGVGMSQNGAKAMGEDGMSFEEILSFYFRDCQLDKIY